MISHDQTHAYNISATSRDISLCHCQFALLYCIAQAGCMFTGIQLGWGGERTLRLVVYPRFFRQIANSCSSLTFRSHAEQGINTVGVTPVGSRLQCKRGLCNAITRKVDFCKITHCKL